MKNLAKEIVKIANELDQAGFCKEAAELDEVLMKVAAYGDVSPNAFGAAIPAKGTPEAAAVAKPFGGNTEVFRNIGQKATGVWNDLTGKTEKDKLAYQKQQAAKQQQDAANKKAYLAEKAKLEQALIPINAKIKANPALKQQIANSPEYKSLLQQYAAIQKKYNIIPGYNS